MCPPLPSTSARVRVRRLCVLDAVLLATRTRLVTSPCTRRTGFTSAHQHRPRQFSVRIHLLYGTAANTAEEGQHGSGYMAPSVSARMATPLQTIGSCPGLTRPMSHAKSLKRKVIPSGVTSAQEGNRPTPRVQCQHDVLALGVYQYWHPQVRRYAAPRPPPPSSASRLRAAARIQSLGVVEHLRAEAYLRAAQLGIADARSLRARTPGLRRAAARGEAGARLRGRDAVRSRPRVRYPGTARGTTWLLRQAQEEVQEKEMRAELAGATLGIIPRTVAQFLEISAVQEMITDTPPRKHEMHEMHHRSTTHHTAVSDARTHAFTGPAQALRSLLAQVKATWRRA
ncbi:hypothetical protein FB451DRAFT_1568481 [Mycena latifolia]|nr:hypothetical protein FB451DRAFT_1568481 [Mycena latifolia]